MFYCALEQLVLLPYIWFLWLFYLFQVRALSNEEDAYHHSDLVVSLRIFNPYWFSLNGTGPQSLYWWRPLLPGSVTHSSVLYGLPDWTLVTSTAFCYDSPSVTGTFIVVKTSLILYMVLLFLILPCYGAFDFYMMLLYYGYVCPLSAYRVSPTWERG